MKISSDISAVVTGGASGLGAAVVTAFSRLGAHVSVFDKDEHAGLILAERLGVNYQNVDVSDADSVATGLSALGGPPLRILVNCAGIAPAERTVNRDGPHDAVTFADTIKINLIGSFNCASQAAAVMAEQAPIGSDRARGIIINTASVAAFEGQVGQVAYAASKGGIVAMTLPMARDLAGLGIRVVAIAPGLFKTPMLEGLPEEVQSTLGAQVPYPSRLGEPTEFSSLVCHIVDNPMLNGEVIRLDGAIRMAPR